MLAYVFWHCRKPSIARADYEASLQRFHRVLAEHAPPGFSHSVCLAMNGGAWANDGGDAYEDWYLVDGSSALDPLNDAAISGRRQAPHDTAAAGAAGGTAGLYRLRHGDAAADPRIAYWFAKPAAWSYAQLYEQLGDVIARGGAALWGRQMTLGPALEFCLHVREPCSLPPDLRAQAIPLRRVWPEDVPA